MDLERTTLLACLLLVACVAPHPGDRLDPAVPPTKLPATPTTAASLIVPPQPQRSFRVDGPPVAVDTRVPVARYHVLSPDGAILAQPVGERSIAYYDVDRGFVVGHTSWRLDRGPRGSSSGSTTRR